MNRPEEIFPLTGIRAFAAFGVLLTHFHTELLALVPGFQIFAPIYSRGGLGVDLFFILSGFIIMHVYGTRFSQSIRAAFHPYLINRFARIYPSYFATLTALVLMVAMAGGLGFSLGDGYPWLWLPAHYLMLQPIPGIPGGWNYPGWSIGAEFFAYLLVFPALILALRRIPLVPVAAFLAALLCLLLFWVPKNLGVWGHAEHLPMVTAEFLAGALIRVCVAHEGWAHLLQRALPWTALALLAVVCLLPSGHWDRMLIVLLFAPFIGGLYRPIGPVAGFFGHPITVYFGHTSYALYLVHALVQKVFLVTLLPFALGHGHQLISYAAFALYLLVPLAAASLLYHVVEEPCRKWIRRLK